MKKVQLILIDGMRPDAVLACPGTEDLLGSSLYTLRARTVMPSVTLPCHMSLFHSVLPERHGITTNLFTPQVRPVKGLFEQASGRRCGLFYDWEELRDLNRPGSLTCSQLFSGKVLGYERSAELVTDAALRMIPELGLGFSFIYLGGVDEFGHHCGWMSAEYLRMVGLSLGHVRRLLDAAGSDTVTLVIADHGGHARSHGTDLAEDMTIPLLVFGTGRTGELTEEVSILDIAPTIADLLEVPRGEEWEGKKLSLLPL